MKTFLGLLHRFTLACNLFFLREVAGQKVRPATAERSFTLPLKKNEMELIAYAALVILGILIIWTFFSKRICTDRDNKYYELSSKLNYITATGTVFIILATYLGINSQKEMKKEYDSKTTAFINEKTAQIDSIIESKDILKAGVYIVNDLEYKENKEYKFDELKTIDNKHLPKFSFPPKLIINTSTGENLRIVKVTNTSFILAQPIAKNFSLWADGENKDYPNVVKFDVWIADYKTN